MLAEKFSNLFHKTKPEIDADIKYIKDLLLPLNQFIKFLAENQDNDNQFLEKFTRVKNKYQDFINGEDRLTFANGSNCSDDIKRLVDIVKDYENSTLGLPLEYFIFVDELTQAFTANDETDYGCITDKTDDFSYTLESLRFFNIDDSIKPALSYNLCAYDFGNIDMSEIHGDAENDCGHLSAVIQNLGQKFNMSKDLDKITRELINEITVKINLNETSMLTYC